MTNNLTPNPDTNNAKCRNRQHHRQTKWSDRAERAIPKISVPTLGQLDNAATHNPRPVLVVLLTRPFVGLAAFGAMGLTQTWIAAPIVLWFLYGSTAAALHHLIHSSMGLSPNARHRWITVLGLLIMESGHAWQATHVIHHRDGSDLPDPEGYIEYLSWSQLPLGALQWRFRITAWGWRHGTQQRRTTIEILANVTRTALSIALIPHTLLPFTYVAMMQIGTFLFAAVLAKGPQTNFGRETTTPLVIVHTRLLGILLFNHHLHVEHHAYPKVPMSRLHHLRPAVEQSLAEENTLHLKLPI